MTILLIQALKCKCHINGFPFPDDNLKENFRPKAPLKACLNWIHLTNENVTNLSPSIHVRLMGSNSITCPAVNIPFSNLKQSH